MVAICGHEFLDELPGTGVILNYGAKLPFVPRLQRLSPAEPGSYRMRQNGRQMSIESCGQPELEQSNDHHWMSRPETADPTNLPYGLVGGTTVDWIVPNCPLEMPFTGLAKFG